MTPRWQTQPDTLRSGKEKPDYLYGHDEYVDMATVVTALYDRISDARRAVQDLLVTGVQREQISVVAATFLPDDTAAWNAAGQAEEGLDAGRGALIGAVGGLLVGMAAVLIPGIGAVLAAGPLAAILVGAGAGTVTGGLVGALIELGLDEQEAQQYSEGVRRGGILVAVQTHDTMTDGVVDVMDRHHPVDIQERAEDWYRSGWTGFSYDS
jgi:hypothetical protein